MAVFSRQRMQSMYKRPARLLIAALSDDGRARTVARLATAPATARWIEARSTASIRQLTPDDLDWADLVVAVDSAAASALPASVTLNRRLKTWDLPPAGSPGVEGAAVAALNGMINGMRMLSRMDDDNSDR